MSGILRQCDLCPRVGGGPWGAQPVRPRVISPFAQRCHSDHRPGDVEQGVSLYARPDLYRRLDRGAAGGCAVGVLCVCSALGQRANLAWHLAYQQANIPGETDAPLRCGGRSWDEACQKKTPKSQL